MQATIPKITRKDLIAIGLASKAAAYPVLAGVIATLIQQAEQFTEATEDDIETFDKALDRAESQYDECQQESHDWQHAYGFMWCRCCRERQPG